MSDEAEDITGAETTPQARIEAATGERHFFLGKPLEPFSFERQAAFQRLSVGSESSLEAATAVVFLCTLGDAKTGLNFFGRAAQPGEYEMTGIDLIDAARGASTVIFRRLIAAWATKNRIGLNTKNGREAVQVAGLLWKETHDAELAPELKGRVKSRARGRVAKPARGNRRDGKRGRRR